MMRRQDVEREHPKAFISSAELRQQYDAFYAKKVSWRRGGGVSHRLPIIALSHCWCAMSRQPLQSLTPTLFT